ncbi:MAG: tetratricopeptide repeat protein, partial [Chitinophagales bacterium]
MHRTSFKLDEASAHFQKGEALIEKFQFKKAIEHFTAASIDYRRHSIWEPYLKSQAKRSLCYRELGQTDLSIECVLDILRILKKKQLPYYEIMVRAYCRLSINYNTKGKHEKAFDAISKGTEIANAQLPKGSSPYFSLYDALGDYYISTTDNGQALFFYQKSLSIALKTNKNYEIAGAYNNIGSCLHRMRRFEEAIESYHKALDEKHTGMFGQSGYAAGTLCDIGACYIYMHKKEEAQLYFEKALAKALHHFDEIHPITSKCYYTSGEYHLSIKKHETAIHHFSICLKILKKLYGRYHFDITVTLLYICKCYHGLQDYSMALNYIQKSLAQALKQDSPSTPYENKYPLQLPNLYEVLLVLYWKANTLLALYQQTHQVKNLIAIWEIGQWAIKIIQKNKLDFKDEQSKLALSKTNTNLYNILLRAYSILAALLDTHAGSRPKNIDKETWQKLQSIPILESAFSVSEESKSILLLANMKNKEAKITANIPQKLIAKEAQLREKIIQLEKSIIQKESISKTKNEEQLTVEKAQFASLKIEYSELTQQLEIDYPQYYQLKHQVESVSVQSLQQKISSNTRLIKYFIARTQIYIFVIDSNEAQFIEVEKPHNFEELIEAFKASIDEIDKTEYSEIAFELYELLIAPIKSLITNHQSLITNLKIIPAGILNTIPFEALLTEKVATNTKYADLPYLLLQYDISYHYSATLWHQALQNKDKKQAEARSTLEEASFVGFAPVYKNEQKQSLGEPIPRSIYNKENTRSIRIGAETYSELIHSEE